MAEQGFGAVGQAVASAQNILADFVPWENEPRPLAGGVSGGFTFPSADDIEELLGLWRARAESIAKRGSIVEQLIGNLGVARPAPDDASNGFQKTFADCLAKLQEQHDSMLAYIQEYIAKLETAKTEKQTGEQNAAEAASKAGGDSGQ
ncbi:hypothetical protein [Amycolatopsis nigrescens]|uniref:hypothetical protein n=1 Tax=Amycolatopsis nigrescens TaxID=381445 RepID=UPI000380E502|nr:hypothetical protein [Amycolatopsis nigrescens]